MKLAVSVFLCAIISIPALAEARSFRASQLPNNEWSCSLCHLSSRGGGPRTGFGEQVRDTLGGGVTSADVDWAAIAELDGDGDGYSNGYELGDPEGTWNIGDPNPEGVVYNPADRDSSPCGDGVLDEQEECDTDELNGAQCSDEGYGPGEVSCSSFCTVSFADCEGFVLPNNQNNETNNTNTNNATNHQTNLGTNGSTNQTNGEASMGDMTSSDDEGCASAGGSPSLVGLLLAGLLARRRQSSEN